jgi:hypothetical protein
LPDTQARGDKADSVHSSLGQGIECLRDFFLTMYIMTQELDAELWRHFRLRLARHLSPTLLCCYKKQDTFDLRGDLLEDLKPLAGELDRVG